MASRSASIFPQNLVPCQVIASASTGAKRLVAETHAQIVDVNDSDNNDVVNLTMRDARILIAAGAVQPSFTWAAAPGLTHSAAPTGGPLVPTDGGTAPFTISVVGGTLPTGMTLSAAGVLGGTLGSGTAGAYSFTLQAVDANGFIATHAYSGTVA